jgi:hypothetical protein
VNLSSLADQFRTAAIEQGDGTGVENDDLFEVLRDCALALTAAGPSGLDQLKTLMHDKSPWVSSWAAAHLLSLGDASAESVLTQLVEGGGLVGFAAEVALSEFRGGRLKSPFRADV